MSEPPEMMTIEEVAQFLRIPVSSVYKLAQAGKLPGAKLGRHWRFYRQSLLEWIAAQSAAGLNAKGKAAPPEEEEPPEQAPDSSMLNFL